MNHKTITITIPSGWDMEACKLWETNRRTEAVQRMMACISKAQWKKPRLALQCGYYMYLLEDYRNAADVLEKQVQVTPDHFEVAINLAVQYSRMGRWDEAERLYRRASGIKPASFVVCDGLAHCLSRLHRYDEAIKAGTRALELKNSACGNTALNEWTLPDSRPQEFSGRPGKRNIISYSLWGAKPRYLRGALRNLLLASDLYPGWVLRFDLDESVPKEFIRLIERLGGEVVMHANNQTPRQRLCWRFQVANDPTVGNFLVRDVDSVVNIREVQAVQAWLTSNKWFHVMRDWWTHTDLMLAGMWGGVAGVLPNLNELLGSYRSPNAETLNIDQAFLRDRVWVFVRESCLVHDRCFRPVGAVPFPGPVMSVDRHVGQDEYSAHGDYQERLLRPWIEAYPSLGPLHLDMTTVRGVASGPIAAIGGNRQI